MGITYNIIENDFQRARAAAYKLSILVGVDSLVYSVYEGATEKLLVLKTLPMPVAEQSEGGFAKALSEVLQKEDLFNTPFGQTKVAFVKGTATLVPKRLFNEDEKEVYLNGLLAEDVAGEIQTDKVKSLKIRAVYKLTDAVVNVLTARFGKVKFYNIATPFLVGSHTVSQQAGQEQTAFLCVHKDTFQLALHQKDELLFYNNFDYSTASDILYFVLLAYEQYGLDPEIAPLYLSGKVVNDSDIYKVLYRYINHISFLSDPSFIKTGKSTATVNHSFFFPLHSLALC